MRSIFSLPTALAALIGLASALPMKRDAAAPGISANPVFQTNFPDPSILQDGKSWFAFATSGNGVHIQMAKSSDFSKWSVQDGYDALPKLPPWVHTPDPQVWAPDVFKRDDGQYLMYYTALHTPQKGQINRTLHCVGHALSSKPEGPYSPISDEPLACPLEQGGAIDPSGFKDEDGTRYLLWKVDGNSIGNGGSCGNTNTPIIPTPIMLQKVAADGFTLMGSATQILDRSTADGPLVEAPSLAKVGGTYYLFFSSNCWNSPDYDINFATASSITGPYTKTGPLLSTGDNTLASPGGADVTGDGTQLVFHANSQVADGRTMYAVDLGKVTGGNFGLKYANE
ncbi:Arabinanase/levansucrase/invertase [Rhizodiscina lignyota]|uniref:Arabinanase/levansucrase/invertase n=1 Tax=Rhizodiscina lignyota TaxID=1504668 RepID=A0A9P4IG19_9PEZI|nr:Arabinanase/levansucrase/invertase [Rhizodiscina lignyota]